MTFYWEPIYKGMVAYGFGNCTKDITAAVRAMDDIMDDATAAANLKEQFLGPEARNNSNAGFADALATAFYLFQSYGVDGSVEGIRSLCDWLETDATTNATAPAEGFAAAKGANYTINRWSAWPYFAQTVNYNMATNCKGTNTGYTTACQLDEPIADPSAISWSWQYCTQWGFLQATDLTYQLTSKFNDIQHQYDICHRQFPDGKASGLLPDIPAADETNAFFGGWQIRPSNVYWSGGQYDPWRTLSLLSDQSFAPNLTLSQDAPACDAETDDSSIYAYVMPDAQHAYDFRTTFDAGATSRKYFTEALTEWLKCWKAGVEPESPASIQQEGRIGFTKNAKNSAKFRVQ